MHSHLVISPGLYSMHTVTTVKSGLNMPEIYPYKKKLMRSKRIIGLLESRDQKENNGKVKHS